MKLPEVGMTEEQRYLFDAFGYIVVPDVISPEQIDELKSTLQSPTEQFDPVGQNEGPLHWAPIWRDLLDLPSLSPILEELIGRLPMSSVHTWKFQMTLPVLRRSALAVATFV